MQIVNPLYDTAFKYLMQSERIACKVLSVILEQDVTSVQLGQQETVAYDEKRSLSLFRLDFKATITAPDGSKQIVLIELQKSKFETDIRRFRIYLGDNYIKSSVEPETAYPIITIYLLGYEIAEIPYLAVTVNRQVINSVSKKILHINSVFINQLTHRSHILQVLRLPPERRSRLEKFMTFFNQAWCTENKYIIDLKEIPEEFGEIAEYLKAPLADDKFRKQLQGEEEIDMIFARQDAKYMLQIEEAKAREKEARSREKEAKVREKEERKQKEEERKQKEEERKQKEEAQNKITQMIRTMKNSGMKTEQIKSITGLSEAEIEKA